MGGRKRRAAKVFQFDKSHSLFSDNTRRCEEKIKKKKQNVEGKQRFYNKRRNEKTQAELERLKASNRQLKKKIAALEKKCAKKN